MSRISAADARLIASNIRSDLLTPEVIGKALLLGTALPPNATLTDAALASYPHVYVLFPHADADFDVASNPFFINIWHDQIVKPAFDCAWRDSGLVPSKGVGAGGLTRILGPTGTRTARRALPAVGFLQRLRNGTEGAVRADWPMWVGDKASGEEGEFADIRVKTYGEAWEAIQGILKDHPDLPGFHDPVLLAVSHQHVHLNNGADVQEHYDVVGAEWDKHADARFINSRSFRVVYEQVVGLFEAIDDDSDDDEEMVHIGGVSILSTPPKRVAVEQDDDTDEDKHRGKRRRT